MHWLAAFMFSIKLQLHKEIICHEALRLYTIIPQMLLLFIFFLQLLTKSFQINPCGESKSLHIKWKQYKVSLITVVIGRYFLVITRISTPKLIFNLVGYPLLVRQLTLGAEIFPGNQVSLNEILTPNTAIYHPTHSVQRQSYFVEVFLLIYVFALIYKIAK